MTATGFFLDTPCPTATDTSPHIRDSAIQADWGPPGRDQKVPRRIRGGRPDRLAVPSRPQRDHRSLRGVAARSRPTRRRPVRMGWSTRSPTTRTVPASSCPGVCDRWLIDSPSRTGPRSGRSIWTGPRRPRRRGCRGERVRDEVQGPARPPSTAGPADGLLHHRCLASGAVMDYAGPPSCTPTAPAPADRITIKVFSCGGGMDYAGPSAAHH